MKNSRRNYLLAALLVCLAPAAASATEIRLTPSSNGDSGAMPSGYSRLYFDLVDGDWVGELKLPEHPRQGDVVELSSRAAWAATLDTSKTTHADLLDLTINAKTNIRLRYSVLGSNGTQAWHMFGGESARYVTLHEEGEATVPMSGHALTDVFPNVKKTITRVNLPAWAPKLAQLAFVNTSANDIEVHTGGKDMACPSTKICNYIFNDMDSAWHARAGYARFQPSRVDLPEPTARVMDVVVGSAAEDLTTPSILRLPATAVEGDVYTLSNPSGDHFTRLLPDHSNLSTDISLPASGITFRYDAATRTWRQ